MRKKFEKYLVVSEKVRTFAPAYKKYLIQVILK